MALEEVCSPAIIYVAFSIIHILIDVFKNSYNAALVKFIIMIVFTTLLNILCERGLGIVSWFIVFIPFITMTLLSQLVLMALLMSKSRENVKPLTFLEEIICCDQKQAVNQPLSWNIANVKHKSANPQRNMDYTLNPNDNVMRKGRCPQWTKNKPKNPKLKTQKLKNPKPKSPLRLTRITK